MGAMVEQAETSRRGRKPKQNAKASQINIRMEPVLKEAGDSVLARLGVTPSEAVRALYEYLVSEQDLPDGLLPDRRSAVYDHWAQEGAGLAKKLLQCVAASPAEVTVAHD